MPSNEWLLSHDTHKFADAGLQLRLPVDLTPPAQYSRLTNAIPTVEGQLQSVQAITQLILTGVFSPVHSLYRLNQSVQSIVGDLLVGIGTRLFHYPLSNASGLTELTGQSYSGNGLSIISFRYTDDQAAWAIIADSQGMRKYRGGVAGAVAYYQTLGVPPPTAPATATAGGVGVLDSTGGTGYDWLYTWLNRVTNSEGNSSPINYTGGSTATVRPTANTNPDPGFGGVGVTNPANAYDGSTVTYASASSASSTEARQSVKWTTWAASGGTPGNLAFQIDAEVIVAGDAGTVLATIYYSTDGGATWNTLVSASATQARNTYVAPIPAGIAFGQLQVKACVFASGQTGSNTAGQDRQNVIANRLRHRGGDFQDIADLLDGGAGNRTIELRVYDINTAIVYIGSAANPLVLAANSANVCVTAPTATQDPTGQITHIRLYRRGGSLPDNWRRVGEYAISGLVAGVCGVGFLTINDNISDVALGDILALDNDMPVSSVSQNNVPLSVIWGPFDERVLGAGDPNRPESVYFSKRGNADQWGSENFVVVSDPGEAIVGGCVYNTRSFAFSTERMFELVPNLIGGVTLTPYPTPCIRGLVAPRAVCVGNAVYFVAKDGIYATTGGEAVSITADSIQPLFPTYDTIGQATHGYEAVDIKVPESISLTYHNGEVWFTYQGLASGSLFQLIYDTERKRWRAWQNSVLSAFTVYSERGLTDVQDFTDARTEVEARLLLGGSNVGGSFDTIGSVFGTLTDTVTSDTVTVHTGSHDQGQPLNLKEYGSVLFDLDPGGAVPAAPITITPYINGEAQPQAALAVSGTGRQQVPLKLGDIFGYNISFRITWGTVRVVLYQYDILWRREPASVTHWETRETSHGLEGWQHVRDMYVTIRSSADVTLTLTVDATITLTFTIPSTGGVRKKLYVPMTANKGKLYRYQFDSSAAFRIYESDCEVRAVSWTTKLGYQVLRPFGGETITLADYRLPASVTS